MSYMTAKRVIVTMARMRFLDSVAVMDRIPLLTTEEVISEALRLEKAWSERRKS